MKRLLPVLALLYAVTTQTACSKATVYTRSGEIISGRIKGSNTTHVQVEQDEFNEKKVARAEILAIDHPGRALLITGGIGTLVYLPTSLYFGASGWRSSQTGQSWDDRDLFFGSMYTTALAITLLVIGTSIRRRSVHAVQAPLMMSEHEPQPVRLATTPPVVRPVTYPGSTSWSSFLAVSR